jgi:rhodanese-related sulfurtransferase
MLFSNSLIAQDAYDLMLKVLYQNSVPLIQSTKLYEQLSKNELTILDTRTQREYEVSHIKNAKFIDYDSFDATMVENIDKSTEVIVYCSVGYRSERIAEKLVDMGFMNVKNLYGGIFSWRNENYPVVNSENELTNEVHAFNRAWGIWLKKGIKIYE